MNVTDTANILNICYYAPSIHPTLISLIQWSYYYIIGYGLVATGVSFGLQTPLMTIMGLFIQTGISFFLWFIMQLAKWKRPPEILTSPHCVPAVVFHDTFNVYGAPNPVMSAVFIYMTFLIYSYHQSVRRSLNWILIPLHVIVYLAYTVFEFVLGRIYGGQFAVNLAIEATLSATICLLIHFLYKHDYAGQLKTLRKQMNTIKDRQLEESLKLQKRVAGIERRAAKYLYSKP